MTHLKFGIHTLVEKKKPYPLFTRNSSLAKCPEFLFANFINNSDILLDWLLPI